MWTRRSWRHLILAGTLILYSGDLYAYLQKSHPLGEDAVTQLLGKILVPLEVNPPHPSFCFCAREIKSRSDTRAFPILSRSLLSL